MYKWLTILIFFCFITTFVQAEENTSLPPFYVGIEKNDQPYGAIDKKNRATGILVDFVDSICKELNNKCEYYNTKYSDLIEGLKTQKIDALLISDHVLIPDIDKVLITPPICKINPIFVQKSTDDIYFNQPEDLKFKTIGVKEGSSLHIYLIENYSNSVHIKTYHMMESAIFDLFFNRIDGLLVGEAFYQDRVYNGPLGNVESDIQLIATKVDGISLSFDSMSLAFSTKNKKLYDDVVSFMQKSRKSIRNCSGFLNKSLSIIY